MGVDRVNQVREGFVARNSDPQWVLKHMSPDVEWVAPEEMIDAAEHVVVIAHRWARNEVTGLQISDKITQVFTFDDEDKCIRVQEFYDRGTALKAAGIGQPE